MTTCYLTGARVVLEDMVVPDGAVLIEDGVIRAISPDSARADVHIDLKGQWLLPGLIDLHCDAIEKEVEPRSRVLFPVDFAVAQIDRRNAAAGITTAFHAMGLAGNTDGVRSDAMVLAVAQAVRAYRPHSLIDNRLHFRYEITHAAALDLLMMLMDDKLADLISVMDHSPGQGQFKSLEAYLQYSMGNHGVSREQAQAWAQAKLQGQSGATERVEVLLARAREEGIPTASHDDDSVQRVASMRNLGVSLSEFPINIDTAKAAVSCGLPTILGAPNVLRGGSQSGSMRAIDAIRAGVASCLCSDYQPSTLLPAVFMAAEQAKLSLSEAVAMVSATPAKACGLADRGAICVGRRADLVAVMQVGRQPTVTRTWSRGRQAFAADYSQG